LGAVLAGLIEDNNRVGETMTLIAASHVLTLPDGTIHEGRLQRDDDGRPIVDTATCGECGFAWNDALITGVTPAPSGRCPNEHGHRLAQG
jgi:predicted Zn-ribbon and HTH transcriptional regulator